MTYEDLEVVIYGHRALLLLARERSGRLRWTIGSLRTPWLTRWAAKC